MGSRRKARETALQVLYQMDLAEVAADVAIRLFWENLAAGPSAGGGEPAEDDEMRGFADGIVRGCEKERAAIDETIRGVSQHWRLERMTRVDRNILRLGVYELMHLADVPRRVTINEAVELAKRYGTESSPGFVNGVLDRIASDLGKD